ncbi:hypothetical protein [Eubacterium callanderi]|uniref:hypothetical protein n=1 Tax=Eubacterium callanderi TaxID=53442 RepID=UPI002671D55D|nr:hypothetical protein [Eubacterium callanderi]
MRRNRRKESPQIETDSPTFESCVLCGKKTHIPIDTPIAARQGYIEGTGQLCPTCYKKIKNM